MNDIKKDLVTSEHVEGTDVQPLTLPELEALDSIEQTPSGRFVWLTSLTAALGGLLFGYDTGIIAAVLVYIGRALDHKNLSASERELITSITSGAAFFGAILAGLCADRFGRRPPIYFGCVLFTIGAALQASAFTVAQMTVGRLVVGFGVGSASMIVPMYIAEIAPARLRGRMIGLDNMSITGGQLVSYGIGAAFANVPGGWRYMVGGGAIPAIILVGLLSLCPESPRQLIYQGRPEEAAAVIRRIYPQASDQQIRDKVRHITLFVDEAKSLVRGKSMWWNFRQLYGIGANFRALTAACGLMAISQLSGFNSLMYYSPTLFSLVGFKDAVAVSTVIAGTNFLFTIVNLFVVDRVGRRTILLLTLPLMGIFLVIAAVMFHWIPIDLHTLDLLPGVTPGAHEIIVLICMVFFVAAYSSGCGNTAWLSSEFFPMEVRALGTMMLSMTCWASNVIVSSTFLTQMENTTPSGAFGFYAAICIFGWVAVYFCYPEVKGVTLEDITKIFQHGFGVKLANEMQRDRKHVAVV
ncbi:myo-inositol transporter [Grosmannia clavigera kw1407]|uniref:Myo-inositol transporter n=1 Tax=Grosmannia clavigera (strain kw1407 / UAMH 11150) TaxID=655863 RepID=F0XBA1_GROCL|nr:myo-inositol transporter [Grosmannia clavigera kw1407]EFX04885.1 myo-inositol transporter [Grosmannia clavigera kw1407]